MGGISSIVRNFGPELVFAVTIVSRLISPFEALSEAPGGWVEKQGTAIRAPYTPGQIQAIVPSTRGPFTFPAPYNTRAIRITDASDCGGTDCIVYVGYSYWRNTNAHEGSNTMWIFLGLDAKKGGSGPTLFQYDKAKEAISKVGPLFPSGNGLRSQTGEGWYFSATQPDTLYINDGPRMLRFNVVSKQFETVFDITSPDRKNLHIWQMHSSNDDQVHSATLRVSGTKEDLGCIVYNERMQQFSYFQKKGIFDECQIDKSGRFLAIHERMTGSRYIDNRFINLQTGEEKIVHHDNNAVGHHDMGYGYIVGANAWDKLPNAVITFSFTPMFIEKGPTVFRSIDWNTTAINHLSHANAQPSLAESSQYVCGSNAAEKPIQYEILCFKLDASMEQLVVAPIMTNLKASGGCCSGDYAKLPKGNLDITGEYFLWTTNLGGDRLDAFLVKVPRHLFDSRKP